MNALHTVFPRQSMAALALAVTTTAALLSSVSLIADRYHAEERVAQDSALAARQLANAKDDSRS